MKRRAIFAAPQTIPLSSIKEAGDSKLGDMKTISTTNTSEREEPRSKSSLRPVFLSVGVNTKADGSAYFEGHKMKVIVSVFGPKEATRFKKFSPKARLNVDLKMASFSKTGSRQSMLRTEEERDMGIQIEKAILPSVFAEKYPKCEIDISVLVLEMDGESSCLAACICASSLALADAGVELRDLVAASGVSVCNPNQVIADASEQEEKRQSGSVFVSVMPSLDEVTHVFYHGKVDASLVVQGFQIAVENANKYYQAMKEAL